MYLTSMTFLMMGQNGSPNPTSSLIFIGGMLVVMYLFMIRPQAKKAKQQKAFNASIQKGERVVTIAGIHGRISKINEDDTLQLEVSPGSYMTIERSAISMEYTTAQQKKAQGTTGAEVKK
ncbi:preprotein translocase subunit YajC [Compostibacter hankyongensis]|uniref:Sec translocon accessory complex subunit YajC n=1 Tax=Compostibacter hankyongensis TaxID=1007089 RepID=A0ABP8FQ54_9BACT